jgi:type II secretory pathway pseudopilin PulG
MENISARTIVLFITGILVAAVLGLFVTLRNSTNSQTQILDLEQIAQAMLLTYQNAGYNYGTGAIPATVLINTGKVPSSIVNGTNINSRFSTPITLDGAGTSYSITLTGIPGANCFDVVSDTGLAQYLTSATVNGTAVNTTPPLNVTTITGACGTSTAADTIVLNFTGHP